MRKLKSFGKVIKHILKYIIKNYKMNYFALVVTSMMMAGTFVLRANIEKNFFDSAYMFYLDSSLANRNNILFYFIMFVIIYILTQTIIHGSNYIEEILELKLQKKLSKEVCVKASYLSAEYFENPNFLDSLEKAQKGKDDAINILLCTTALVTYYIPYIIFMSIWLWSQSALLVITILLAFVPTVISYTVQVDMFSENEDNVAPLRRKAKAYEDSMIGKGQEKETRILGGYKFFMFKYKEVLSKINDFDLSVIKKRQNLNVLLRVIQSLGFVSIIMISVYLAAKGEISVGAFAAVFTSIDILFSNLNEAVSRQYASISESFGTVENYYKFIEDETYVKTSCQRGPITKVENLSFRYPNSEFESLKNISFEIKPGERIAVVGENGAGKSTLAKLLLGMYSPTSGNIYTLTNKDYEYTAVFQNYMKYSMSLKDNIVLSDSDKNHDFSDLTTVLSKAGLDIENEKFIAGFDTVLGKEFGGMELSGGEWQKLAIARGVYKDFDFIVFDEPTASIDPIEESNIYNMINDLTTAKTSLVITHRMATVRFADRIFVLKQGELVEIGTHEELMKLKGEYCRLYESQKNNYADPEKSKCNR